MIILNLNLLSPTKKERVERVVKYLFAKNILEIILVTCSVLAISLLLSWLVLQEHFTDLSSAATTVNKEYSAYNKEIRDVNKTIKNLYISSGEYAALSPKLLELSALMPPDIKMNAVIIDREAQTVSLIGTAKTRLTFIAFQEILKNVTWLQNIESPFSQLLQKENINFEIKAKLKGMAAIKIESAAPQKDRLSNE